jgi:hypothetical protein
MEAVAIGASIIAFIQVADRVIDLCKAYLEVACDAPSELRAILIETSVLKTIMDNLQFLASCGHAPTSLNILTGKEGSIAGCLRAINEIEGLFRSRYCSSKQPKSSSKRQKVEVTLTALAWPFKENRARKLLGELVQHKTTINLALSTESLLVLRPPRLGILEVLSANIEQSRYQGRKMQNQRNSCDSVR